MIWHNIIVGGMTVLMAYAFFAMDEDEAVEKIKMKDNGHTIVNMPSGRLVTLSCQTCRKLKKHREIETNLYECTKCKRKIDLRAS